MSQSTLDNASSGDCQFIPEGVAPYNSGGPESPRSGRHPFTRVQNSFLNYGGKATVALLQWLFQNDVAETSLKAVEEGTSYGTRRESV